MTSCYGFSNGVGETGEGEGRAVTLKPSFPFNRRFHPAILFQYVIGLSPAGRHGPLSHGARMSALPFSRCSGKK
jgi:hypothetical protein